MSVLISMLVLLPWNAAGGAGLLCCCHDVHAVRARCACVLEVVHT